MRLNSLLRPFSYRITSCLYACLSGLRACESRPSADYVKTPWFVQGATNVWVYRTTTSKRGARSEKSDRGQRLFADLSLIISCPTGFKSPEADNRAKSLRAGLKFGGREHVTEAPVSLNEVSLQHGSDPLRG